MEQLKLNPNVKQLWTNALRSGDYEQGRRALRTLDDKFCCLGVLCDLYDKSLLNPVGWQCTRAVFPADEVRLRVYFNQFFTPPQEVMEWAFKNYEPSLSHYCALPLSHIYKNLMIMNDSGASFSLIADTIDEYF